MADHLKKLFDFISSAPPEVQEKFAALARDNGADFAQAASAPRPADAPPLWAERTTGREVSPADWIRMHYGNKDPENWDAMGLTSSDLRQSDRALYQAYASWISRKPSDGLNLPKLTYITFDDPVEHLEHKREAQRLASARYRAKKSL